MTDTAKGLYAPRFVDITFAVMGLGSAALLIKADSLDTGKLIDSAATSGSGLYLLAAVLLVAASACLMHRIDRKGWDDYMGQIVSQSALIALVTLLLVGVIFDFLIAPTFALIPPVLMIQGMIPIACTAWAIGYFFLRWRGTGQ